MTPPEGGQHLLTWELIGFGTVYAITSRNTVPMYTSCTNSTPKILLDKNQILCYNIIKIRQQGGNGENRKGNAY